jgi:pimeloyl-ACP methyl ester carboxylesterase
MPGNKELVTSFNDVDVQVMRRGSGAPLLYLHGLNGGNTWLPFMDRLAGQFDVIAPQHPGFGGTQVPGWLDNVADLANFYLEFIERNQLQGVHLVGFDLGGWIAAELATRNASALRTLSLVGAYGMHVDGGAPLDIFLQNDAQLVDAMFFNAAAGEQERGRLEDASQADVLIRDREIAARLMWNPRGYNPHLIKWLRRISVPTHIFWGEHDRLLPIHYGHAYRDKITHAEFTMFPSCGHVPQVEQADAFVAAFSKFIKKTEDAA